MLKLYQIKEGVYRITGAGCDVYLFDDADNPVLVDCGCSKENIRQEAEQIINKSVEHVLITHSHIDHCGHAGLFPNVYMTKDTFLTSKNPMDENPDYLHLEYHPIIIEDGQILEFGDLKFEVIECGTHCAGNVMYLEKKHGLLLTGDEIDQDQVLLLPSFTYEKGKFYSTNASSVKQYQDLLKRVWKRHREILFLCTGHNGSPLPKETILKMIELCECILQGEKGKKDCSSPTYGINDTHFPNENANYLRFEKEGLSLVYCADDLFDTNKNSTVSPATRLHVLCEKNLYR